MGTWWHGDMVAWGHGGMGTGQHGDRAAWGQSGMETGRHGDRAAWGQTVTSHTNDPRKDREKKKSDTSVLR